MGCRGRERLSQRHLQRQRDCPGGQRRREARALRGGLVAEGRVPARLHTHPGPAVQPSEPQKGPWVMIRGAGSTSPGHALGGPELGGHRVPPDSLRCRPGRPHTLGTRGPSWLEDPARIHPSKLRTHPGPGRSGLTAGGAGGSMARCTGHLGTSSPDASCGGCGRDTHVPAHPSFPRPWAGPWLSEAPWPRLTGH